jgi:hypothetical protein
MIFLHEMTTDLQNTLVSYEDLVLLHHVVETDSFNESSSVTDEHEISLHVCHDIDQAVVFVRCRVKM